MNRDFQERYQRAEHAYGEERYADAHDLALGLLNELNEIARDDENEAAWFGWRSFVALLLGHISLYGLEQPTEASTYYQLVLESQPPDTQEQLAQQGLERARMAANTAEPLTGHRSEPEPDAETPSEVVAEPEPELLRPPTGDLPDLLKDPFLLSDAPASDSNPTPSRSTAMPWLDDGAAAPEPVTTNEPAAVVTAEPEAEPEPEPEPEPEAEPEPEPESEVEAVTESDPEAEADPIKDLDEELEDKPQPAIEEPSEGATSAADAEPETEEVAITFLESELVDEPVPEESPSRSTTKDDAMNILQDSWIRIDVSALELDTSGDPQPLEPLEARSVSTELPSWLEPGQLNLQFAVDMGWRAFRASPWTFVGFTMIGFLLSAISGLTVVGPALTNLWLITGLTRGAWMAVHGQRPTLGDLVKVDLGSWWRLFLAALLVNFGFFIIAAGAGFAAGAVVMITPWLSILIVVIAVGVASIFGINQSLLPYFTTLHRLGPINAVQAGQQNVGAVKGKAFLLMLVETLMLIAGLALIVVGLFAAVPLIFCVSAAAFRQIMGPLPNED